ncbi:MAG: FliH/SctL family protein [Endozoicomonas sp.]|uniref:FliH/SctL family protein n=1 Tax=Endozoicomonas sp. TaxID=1892382 RepID=UPI003D9B560A
MKRNATIFKSGTTEFQRYSLPSAKDESESFPAPETVSEQTAPQEQQVSAAMTLQDLQQSRQEGYDDGYRTGLEAGRIQGIKEGHEQGLKQGIEEGYIQGQDKGYRDGLSAGEEELQNVLRNLDLNLQNIQQYYKTRKDELSYWLSALIEEVSRQVIRTELKLQPEMIMNIVRETLTHLPDENSQLTIHMHPEDVAQLRKARADFSNTWTLLEDDQVAQGDCRVITETAEASASVEERLSACMEILRESLPEELDRSLA